MQVFKRYVSARGLTVFGFENVLIIGSVLLVAHLHTEVVLGRELVWKTALAAALLQVCLYYNDFYDLTLVHSDREVLVRLLQALGAATILLGLVYVIVPSLMLDATIFFPAMALLLSGVLAWRFTFTRIADARHLDERVLIVGAAEPARRLAQELATQKDFPYHIIGLVAEDARQETEARAAGWPVAGRLEDLPELARPSHVDRLIVSMSDARGRLPISTLLDAKLAGVSVEDGVTAYERVTGKIHIETLKPSWLVFSDGFQASKARRVTKRALDLVLSLVGLLVAWPLIALTALLVWLDDGSPVLYRQERVGLRGRRFMVLKFRSMRKDAEKGGPTWAKERDERVTRIGRFIRLTRLDELPQLWNVLRGEMSFVGPRPERPYFVEQLSAQVPFYAQRHSVRPGITGWAQIKYRYGSSVEDAIEKLQYDLYYIKHLSPAFDLSIVFDTVKVILLGKGAL